MAFLELQCPKSNALAQRWTFTWNSLERCCGRPDSAKRHAQTLRCAWQPSSPGAHGEPLVLVRLALPRRGETGAAPPLLDSARRTGRIWNTLPTRSSSHARATATSTTPAWCRGSSASSHSLGRSLLSRSVSLRWLQSGTKTNPGVQTACQQHTRKCFRGKPRPQLGCGTERNLLFGHSTLRACWCVVGLRNPQRVHAAHRPTVRKTRHCAA